MKYLNKNNLPWNPSISQMPIGKPVLVMKGDGTIPFVVTREDDEVANIHLGNDSHGYGHYVLLSDLVCWLDVCVQIGKGLEIPA